MVNKLGTVSRDGLESVRHSEQIRDRPLIILPEKLVTFFLLEEISMDYVPYIPARFFWLINNRPKKMVGGIFPKKFKQLEYWRDIFFEK